MFGRGHAAGGIGWEIQNDDARPVADERREIATAETEICFLVQMKRHRLRAHIAGERFVNRKTGARINHFIARIAVGLLRQTNGRFAAGENDDAIRRDVDLACARHNACNRFAQRQNTLRIAIVRQIEIDLALDFIRDMPGQRKVRFAQIALDDFVTLQLELANLRPDAKRVFAADAASAIGKKAVRAVFVFSE